LNVEDHDLATRASRGDVEAFTKLVRAHSSLVYRVALRMLGKEDAHDASQEVWVRVWKNIKGFRAHSAFSTWLSFRQRVYLSAFLRQAKQIVRGVMGNYLGALAFYRGLLPARQQSAVRIGGYVCRMP
jgi:DNA-directed RNA polymerase specialized sigma24 family protein